MPSSGNPAEMGQYASAGPFQPVDVVNSGNQPLSDVAAACGYLSPSRFTAAFRQRFGVTPSQLRQQRDHAA